MPKTVVPGYPGYRKVRRFPRVFTVFRYVALTALVAGTVLLGIQYAHAEANATAYGIASSCSGSGGAGCAEPAQVDVLDAGETNGKSTTYWLDVTGDTVPEQTVDLNCQNDASFFLTAQGNGRLTAQVWQGTVASLTYNGTATCGTENSPGTVASDWLFGVGAVGSFAAGWLVVIARTRIRGGRDKTAAAVAAGAFFVNVPVFGILDAAVGNHSGWLYPLGYVISVAIIALFMLLAVVRKQRKRNQFPLPSAGLRPKRRVNGRTVNLVLILIFAAAGLILLAVYIPAQSNAFAYENAPACQSPATSGCVQHVAATVVDSGDYQSGDSSDKYWIEINGPGISDLQFTLSGDSAWDLVNSAPNGTKITAFVWKGRVTEIENEGFSSPGPSTPMRDAADLLGGCYAVCGVVLFWVLVTASTRTRHRRRVHLYAAGGIVLLVGGGFAFIPLVVEAKPVLWAAPLTLAISAVIVVPFYILCTAMGRRSKLKRQQTLAARQRGRPAPRR